MYSGITETIFGHKKGQETVELLAYGYWTHGPSSCFIFDVIKVSYEV